MLLEKSKCFSAYPSWGSNFAVLSCVPSFEPSKHEVRERKSEMESTQSSNNSNMSFQLWSWLPFGGNTIGAKLKANSRAASFHLYFLQGGVSISESSLSITCRECVHKICKFNVCTEKDNQFLPQSRLTSMLQTRKHPAKHHKKTCRRIREDTTA